MRVKPNRHIVPRSRWTTTRFQEPKGESGERDKGERCTARERKGKVAKEEEEEEQEEEGGGGEEKQKEEEEEEEAHKVSIKKKGDEEL